MSKYKVADTNRSVEKDGKRLSAAETAEELQRLAKENERLKSNKTESDSDETRSPMEIIGLGMIIGFATILLFIFAMNTWDGIMTWMDAISYLGGLSVGLGMIFSVIAYMVKFVFPKIWGWLKTRWNRIGSSSDTPEEV